MSCNEAIFWGDYGLSPEDEDLWEALMAEERKD